MRRAASILLTALLAATTAWGSPHDEGKSTPAWGSPHDEGKSMPAGGEPVTTTETESAVPVMSSFPTELTVNGLVSLASGNFVLQMGAYSRRANAGMLRDRIAAMTGLEADIIEEENLFKVIINSSLRGAATFLYIPVSFPGEARAAAARQHAGDNRGAMAAANPAGNALHEPGYATRQAGDTTSGSADTLTAATITPAGEPAVAPTPVSDTTVAGEGRQEASGGRLARLFTLQGDNLWLSRHNYFGKSVALVNALIIAIIISFATMFILLLVILFNRRRMEREAMLRQYLLEQYQALIIDYLFGSAGAEQFRKIASDEYRRQVLIDQMIDVSVNLKGESREKLTQLYTELELDHDSLARARSRRWHKKVKGFRELAFMGITDGNEKMYKALNSKNEILRMEAQIALVRLSDKDHFEFLSQLKRPFSLWEQITLHDLIIQHELPVPDFRRWLTSENPTVVLFALRMIREFRQTEAEADLHKTLLHRDQRVSRMALEVAGDLDMRSTLDTMKRMYKYQEYNNCLEIVRSMGKMPDLSMLGFLKLVLDKEDDVQLQIEAVKAMENMGETGVQALVKIMKSEYKNYNIIVRHVLDRRIY